MAGREKRAIDFTEPLSEKEAEKIFVEFSKISMADVLTELFKEISDHRTFRFKGMSYKHIIYAGIKRDDVQASLSIEKVSGKFKWVTLRIYNGLLEQVPKPNSVNPDCLEMVSIMVGPTKTGLWKDKKGNQIIYTILVSQHGAISLPTESGKWLFTALYRLAQLANEFHLNLSEQPRFWEKEENFKQRAYPEDLPDVE